MAYELLYGTVHCTGRITYNAGTVPTKDDALNWCETPPEAVTDKMRVPETDPLRWCPVRHCHMKRQRPWRAFRLIPATVSPTAGSEKM